MSLVPAKQEFETLTACRGLWDFRHSSHLFSRTNLRKLFNCMVFIFVWDLGKYRYVKQCLQMKISMMYHMQIELHLFLCTSDSRVVSLAITLNSILRQQTFCHSILCSSVIVSQLIVAIAPAGTHVSSVGSSAKQNQRIISL